MTLHVWCPSEFCGVVFIHGPHRLVVRTSRCGRDNPGSNPGVDTGPWLFLPTCSCEVRVCVRGNYLFHDLPASSRDIAARRVTVIVDSMEKRRSPDDLGFVVPLRFFRIGFSVMVHIV